MKINIVWCLLIVSHAMQGMENYSITPKNIHPVVEIPVTNLSQFPVLIVVTNKDYDGNRALCVERLDENLGKRQKATLTLPSGTYDIHVYSTKPIYRNHQFGNYLKKSRFFNIQVNESRTNTEILPLLNDQEDYLFSMINFLKFSMWFIVSSTSPAYDKTNGEIIIERVLPDDIFRVPHTIWQSSSATEKQTSQKDEEKQPSTHPKLPYIGTPKNLEEIYTENPNIEIDFRVYQEFEKPTSLKFTLNSEVNRRLLIYYDAQIKSFDAYKFATEKDEAEYLNIVKKDTN